MNNKHTAQKLRNPTTPQPRIFNSSWQAHKLSRSFVTQTAVGMMPLGQEFATPYVISWLEEAPSNSFVAGTGVITGIDEDGNFITTNIEDLRVGDVVLAGVMLGSGLTQEQAEAIFAEGKVAVVFALLELTKRLADAEAKNNPAVTPSTPSAMVAPYHKPTVKQRGHDPIRTVVAALQHYLLTNQLPPLPSENASDG